MSNKNDIIKETSCKIDLISPIKIFFSKKNWENSLLFWVIIFCIISVIDSIFTINKQSNLIIVVNFFITILSFGYIRLYLHNQITDGADSLPLLNFKKMITISLNLFVVILPFILLIIGLLVPLLILFPTLIKAYNISSILALTSITIIFILITIFAIFAECSYLKTFKLCDGFKYYEIFNLFQIGWVDVIKTSFLAFMLITPIALTLYLIGLALKFGFRPWFITYHIRPSLFLNPIFNFSFDLIKLNLIAQVYKNSLSSLQDLKMNKGKMNLRKIIIVAFLFIILFTIFYFVVPIVSRMLIEKTFYFGTKNTTLFLRYFLNYIYNYLLKF